MLCTIALGGAAIFFSLTIRYPIDIFAHMEEFIAGTYNVPEMQFDLVIAFALWMLLIMVLTIPLTRERG